MSNDLQADIVTRLKGGGLTDAKQGVEKVTKATDQLTKAERDMQRHASQAFAVVKAGARDSKEQIDRLNRSLQGLEGPLGGVSRKMFGAFRVGGGMGAAAGGVVAVTAAITAGLKIYNMMIDANVEKVRKQIDAQRDLSRAQEDARKSASQAANATGKQFAGSIRSAHARLGEGGVEKAMDFARNSPAGISSDDAIKGFGEASLMDEGGDAAIRAAEKVASTGEMSFSDAINRIRNDPYLLQQTKDGRSRDVIARLIVQARGQDASDANMTKATQSVNRTMPDDWDLTSNKNGGGLLNRSISQNRADVATDAIGLGNFKAGAGEGALTDQVNKARDPVAAATTEVLERLVKMQQEMLQIEKAHGPLYNAIFRRLESLGLKYKIGSEGLPGGNL